MNEKKVAENQRDSDAVWDQYLNQPAPETIEEPDSAQPFKDGDKSTGLRYEGIAPPDIGKGLDERGDILHPLHLKIDEIQNQMQQILQEFQRKLKYDEHKNKIIDTLHQELQTYRGDVIKKYFKTFIIDIIQFIDSIKKMSEYYMTQDKSMVDPKKLLDVLNNIPLDLEDICSRQGVFSFSSETNVFDGTRQRALKRVETFEPEKDKTIAERIRPGYEWDDQIIRPEMVAVYVYIPPPVPVETDKEKTAAPMPDDRSANGGLKAQEESAAPVGSNFSGDKIILNEKNTITAGAEIPPQDPASPETSARSDVESADDGPPARADVTDNIKTGDTEARKSDG
jgi:molecular chaperone GrpE (heat shock protein)